MRVRIPLYAKILFWFFLNLVVIATVLLLLFNLQFRLEPGSALLGSTGEHIGTVTRLIASELNAAPEERWSAILERYSEAYGVRFALFSMDGTQLAGEATTLPSKIRQALARPVGDRPEPPPREGPPPFEGARPRGGLQGGPHMHRRMPPPLPLFRERTSDPTLYWAGARVPLANGPAGDPRPVALIAISESMSGNGLFFDPTPWFVIAAVVFVLSILLWLPFVRSITRAVSQMTAASEQIAEERFDVRVDDRRSDELGRLGEAINHLAVRLSGFVAGQRQFLGDISHELNSPLARLQFALGILEQRVDATQQSYVADALEEAELMGDLVDELLAYARAGIRSSEVELERVDLLEIVRRVVAREGSPAVEIRTEVPQDLEVLAHPTLLARAVANAVRNAVRYAGDAGPITVSAERHGDRVLLSVADSGSGVPTEHLPRLFDPFYRLETDRARNTGGTGLGLTILRSCIESCGGTVSARNVPESGLEVRIELAAAPEAPVGAHVASD